MGRTTVKRAQPRARRTRSALRLGLLAALALGVATPAAGCRARGTAAPLTAETAPDHVRRLVRHLDQNPEDWDAWLDLAHLYWMHAAEPDKAVEILDRLVARPKVDPVARAARMLIADARLETTVVREQGMALVRVAATGRVPPPITADGKGKRRRRRGEARAPLALSELQGLAEVAARNLERTHGEEQGDDERYLEFYAELEKGGAFSRLPVTITRPLISLRAKIARRTGNGDYKALYDRQGCVRAWTVGGLEGTLASLELRRLEGSTAALQPDPGAQLTSLSCVVRVWNPTPRAGIRRMQTELDVPNSGALTLEIATQTPARVYLDGHLVHRSDRSDLWPADKVRLDAEVSPGRHRVEVRVSIPKDRTWVMLRATDGQGKAVPASQPANPSAPQAREAGAIERRLPTFSDLLPPPADLEARAALSEQQFLSAPIYEPLRLYLGGINALADGDTDRAELAAREIKTRFDRFAEGQMFIAAFEADDPSRERTASQARQRSALERAVELDGALDRARVRLLEMGLDRGESVEVTEAIEAMPEGAMRHVEGELLRFRAYTARGNEFAAEQALERASDLHPGNCSVLRTQRAVAQGRVDVRREDQIVERLADCPGTLGLRAKLAYRRGDTKSARALLEQRLGRSPDDVDALSVLGDIAVTEKRWDDALRLRKRVIELKPYASSARLAIADLAARAGQIEVARKEITEALALVPYSSALHEIAENLGLEDDLWRLRVDGSGALLEYRATSEDAYAGASEVLVLDRSASRIYPDGSVRQIVHTVTELRSKAAIDKYGEFVPPEGARLLTLQSIKPDGTIVEPERIPGKDGLSLRGLAIGDAVELEFVLDHEPNPLLPGYLDVGRFSFRSVEVPFHTSELVIAAPRAMRLNVETRGGAPRASERVIGDLRYRTWKVTGSPPLGVEPAMRSLIDEVPSVRVFTDLDVAAWLESLTLQLVSGQRSNPELRTLAKDLTKHVKGAREKLEILHDWALENIEDTGDISAPATMTLSAKQGSRLMLLKAMLRVVGVRAELWIGRDRFGPLIKQGGHPMVETYAAPALAVWTGEGETPVIVMANTKVTPIGYTPPGLSGSTALRVRLDDDEGAPGIVTVPPTPKALADRRSHTLEVELDASGAGTVSGEITLQGMEALVWRQEMRKVDRDRLPEGFERAELSRLFRGATIDVEDLEIIDEAEHQKPLRLKFSATIRGAAAQRGGDLVMPSAIVPMNLGYGFTSLPQRATGMVIPYAPLKTSKVTIRLRGAKFTAVPEDIKIERDHGSYARAVVDGGAGQNTVTIETRSTLVPSMLEPAAYPDLAALTGEIKAAEDAILRAR